MIEVADHIFGLCLDFWQEMLQEEDDDDVRGRGAEEKSNDIR